MPRETLKSLRDQLAVLEEDNARLLTAQEEIYSTTTMLERRLEELAFIDLSNIYNANEEVIPQAKRVDTIRRIRRLRHENPQAKQSIKLIRRFVLGKGMTYDCRDSNTLRILDDFWNDPVNQAVWTSHAARIRRFDELLTDGEQFPVFFPATGEAPYVRTGRVKMEEITNTLTDPDNDDVVVWYRRAFKKKVWNPRLNNGEGAWEADPGAKLTVRYYRDFRVTDEYLADVEERGLKIPKGLQAEGVIKHRMINEVLMRSGLRGVSELFASREWFRVFKEFMEDRGAINAAANALAYQRKIMGGPVAVAAQAGKLGGLQVTPSTDQPLTPSSFRRPLPGSIIDTNTNAITSIRADTGAAAAARDAELIRGTAASGEGLPDHYLGSTNTALAGAQAVEVAVTKVFEDFQTYLRNDDRETAEYVLSVARDQPISEVAADAREIAWKYPPIATHDLVKWITGFAQWSQQIAPKNRVVREVAIKRAAEVLNISEIDLIWDEIVEEEQRLAEIEDEQREMQMQAQQVMAQGGPPGLNGAGKKANGSRISGDQRPSAGQNDGSGEGGQKAGGQTNIPGSSPDLMRLTRGRPPREGATGPRSRRQ